VSTALAGINILVTRPSKQAGDLAEKVRLAGGNPVLFPVLEIRDTNRPGPFLDAIARLDEFDLAIFISPNAVEKAMTRINATRTFPPSLTVVAVGQGTRNTLRDFGIHNAIVPSGRFDSEALLELPELSEVTGKRVLIFRGDGGRELLGETLLKRGATVTYVECYRRVKPEVDTAPLLRAAASGELDAIIITSSEGLRNLWEMVGAAGQTWLKNSCLFVSHERIAQTASTLGFTRVILTAPGDHGLLEAISNYFRTQATGKKDSVSSRQ
jgi:uroporphyrinogen-III synthase